MDTERSRIAYRLTWELDHLEALGTAYDALLIEFPESDDLTGQLWRTTPATVTAPIVFEPTSQAVFMLDYPYTNARWTIVSQQMYLALIGVKNFSHQLTPVSLRGGFPDGSGNRLHLLQILEHADVFDATRSVYERKSENKPGRYLGISSYALNAPVEGYPPIFRIRANPTELFVSGSARDAFKAAGIRGVAYQALTDTGDADEVDVPVSLVIDRTQRFN